MMKQVSKVALMLLIVGAGLCMARPSTADQASSSYSDLPYMMLTPGETSQVDNNALDTVENDFRIDPRFIRELDDDALMRRLFRQDKINLGRNTNMNLRAIRPIETKRQIRYRQCYFNPISCFRK